MSHKLFKLLQPPSTDAGKYSGMKDFDWENNAVEGVYMNDKKNGIYVLGEEFIRFNACPEAFKQGQNVLFSWGCFEEIV